MFKKLLVLLCLASLTGCSGIEISVGDVSKESKSTESNPLDYTLVDEGESIEIVESDEDEYNAGSDQTDEHHATVVDTVDGYKVYYLSDMRPEEFPNVIGAAHPLENTSLGGVLCYTGGTRLYPDSKCSIDTSSFEYIDKIVLRGVEITADDLSFNGIYQTLEKISSVIPLSSATFGTAGLSGDRVFDKEMEGTTGISASQFESVYPRKVKSYEYDRFGRVSFFTTNEDATVDIEWNPAGEIYRVSVYISSMTRDPGKQDIDFHTVYLTVDGEKFAVILDAAVYEGPEYHPTYYGTIYIE